MQTNKIGGVKYLGGEMWWCCPVCGKKIQRVKLGATCRGVMGFCKHCKTEAEIIINCPTH